jgi:hypothetical protein
MVHQKKTKIKCSGDLHCATTPSAYNIPKSVEKNSKIKAKDVFDYGKKEMSQRQEEM